MSAAPVGPIVCCRRSCSTVLASGVGIERRGVECHLPTPERLLVGRGWPATRHGVALLTPERRSLPQENSARGARTQRQNRVVAQKILCRLLRKTAVAKGGSSPAGLFQNKLQTDYNVPVRRWQS